MQQQLLRQCRTKHTACASQGVQRFAAQRTRTTQMALPPYTQTDAYKGDSHTRAHKLYAKCFRTKRSNPVVCNRPLKEHCATLSFNQPHSSGHQHYQTVECSGQCMLCDRPFKHSAPVQQPYAWQLLATCNWLDPAVCGGSCKQAPNCSAPVSRAATNSTCSCKHLAAAAAHLAALLPNVITQLQLRHDKP
jgi:hypothetical protein